MNQRSGPDGNFFLTHTTEDLKRRVLAIHTLYLLNIIQKSVLYSWCIRMMRYHMYLGMSKDRSTKPCPNSCGYIMSIDTVVCKDIIQVQHEIIGIRSARIWHAKGSNACKGQRRAQEFQIGRGGWTFIANKIFVRIMIQRLPEFLNLFF